MNKTWLIISREYITRVRKKSFVLMTILGPLFFALIMILPIVITQWSGDEQTILVLDESGMLGALPDTSGIYFRLDKSGASLETLKAALFSGDSQYDALLYMPITSTEQPRGIMLYSKDQLGITTRMYIEQVIADRMERINLENRNLSYDDLLSIRPKIFIQDKVLSESTQEQDANILAATGLAYIMGFLTYIALLIYGSMVMRGVMEEKTSRIVEVMISTVKPFQLMVGKIIGIGAVGLTQFFIWGILLIGVQLSLPLFLGDQMAAMQEQATMAGNGNAEAAELARTMEGIANMPLGKILWVFLVFFLGGYFLYASLFAAVGSLVSDEESEVQMYSFPLTMLILVSIFIATAVIQQPGTKLAFWASVIPLSSPIVMPALIPFGVPGWQLALSITMLILGFLGSSWIAGKIYRTGILMYGKKIRWRELWRWIMYKN